MHEIDGVRGIALTLVVLFHVFGNGRVSGGVDVFLVLSAYFLTRKLLGYFGGSTRNGSSAEAGTWLKHHFLRVSSRLVPSAVIVLTATFVAAWLWGPATHLLQTLREIRASALYYENWELISSQLAYEAAGPETSPVQHFWSLAVQGQFFLVWPFIALVISLIARRVSHVPFRGTFLVFTGIATTASFIWAIILVNADQQVAYFSSFSRFWELGAGALIAFVPASFMAWPWIREASTWVGLAMIVLCGVLFDGGSLFPGYAALWPVLASLFVLFGASRAVPAGLAASIMSIAPVTFFARIAYQLYLWHWPILVFYLQVRDYSKLGWKGAVLVLGLSLVLAILTERITSLLISRSLKDWNWKIAVAVPLLPTVVLSLVSYAGIRVVVEEQEKELLAATQLSEGYKGALALFETDQLLELEPRPAPSAAYVDRPEIYKKGAECMQTVRDEPGAGAVLACDLDDYRTENRTNGRTVVMTGGSHVVQWYPAMVQIAQEQNWRLVVIDKNGCRLSVAASNAKCAEWNQNAVEVIASYAPDLIFTLGSVANPSSPDKIEPGAVEVWRELTSRGFPIIGIRDTPRLPFDVPECLEENGIDSANCTYPRSAIYSDDIEATTSNGELPEKFTFVDISDAVVGAEEFRSVVGNLVVYRDGTHMTATYAATTKPMLERGLREAAPFVFGE
ncbi:acyltransferase family protein [Leucobacter sp. HY1908]